MKKIIYGAGIIGTAFVIVHSIIDHIWHFNDKYYFIMLMIGIVFMLPMLVREAMNSKSKYMADENNKYIEKKDKL